MPMISSAWNLETRGLDLVMFLHLCVFLKNKFLEYFLDQSIIQIKL